MSISPDSKFPCQGSECEPETLASLDWQTLAVRFDNEVLTTDFGAWIENDLADMESRLNQFATKSTARQSR